MMRKAMFQWMMGAVVMGSAFGLAGCHIETYNGEDMCMGGPKGGSDAKGSSADTAEDTSDKLVVCTQFCNHLFGCGNVTPTGYPGCLDDCVDAFDAAPSVTRAGCKCVSKSSCSASGTYACPGAPAGTDSSKPTSTTGADAGSTGTDTAGTSTGTGSSGTTTGTSAFTCKKNQDCAAAEDCVAGYCLLRCKASCECHTNESCVAGYCSLALTPPASCQVDCECPAGQACVNNACK